MNNIFTLHTCDAIIILLIVKYFNSTTIMTTVSIVNTKECVWQSKNIPNFKMTQNKKQVTEFGFKKQKSQYIRGRNQIHRV